MANLFFVVTVRHPEGERLPILLDADRQPVVWINLYILKRLRRRLSFNSLLKVTRILGFIYAWSLRQKFSLRERLESGNGLTQNEIDSLCSWLRRNFRTADAVRSLAVAPSSVKSRLDVARQFVDWHFNAAISARPVGSNDIKDIRAKQTACKQMFADAAKGRTQSSEHAKALLEPETRRLLAICEVDSPENPWKRPCRVRNRLIIHLMLALGLRRGELLKLRTSDCHLTRAIPEIRVERSPDDDDDPRINEPQVKTESRHLPCERQLARDLHQFICVTRRETRLADRMPFLFLSRTGLPLSLNRVNGIVSQIGLRHPEFADLHPHCLRSTCATDFKETARRRGLDESDIDKDMQTFFGWRSDQSIAPYVEGATRREAAEIGLAYQQSLFGSASEAS
ncbi:tyrosine-type recombinase/integrase [Paraburkholderia pallida]|uniref:Site-specific integrase n=1 Tax=Paraburkholderia pallida TaxID=2547399 RepID=A0A4P7CPT4_9BURK|nr:site-specific integrase [Paraburkholderia pallida]QBQ95929.1 site-specific integrase [Paraburkholderia pallida]